VLCFLFAALIVLLDQFFKRWILRTLDVGEIGAEIIPGVLGLTRWENDGAMLNILSGQQWLLAGIAFIAAIVLIMILLRYNEGFWGTIGLASVLGGTVGNLIDRIFHDGKVIDMFQTLFMRFPIFNFADIFITLGFLTFLAHFIALTLKSGKSELENASDDYYDEDYYDEDEQSAPVYDEFPEINNTVSTNAKRVASDPYRQSEDDSYETPVQQFTPQPRRAPESLYTQIPRITPEPDNTPEPQYASAPEPEYTSEPQYASEPQYEYESQYESEPVAPMSNEYEPITETTYESSFSLDALELELGSLEDYNIDDLLREYGFDDD